jgi:hypothetical protein
MSKVIGQGKGYVQENMLEIGDKESGIVRWIPSKDNGEINGKLVNFLPTEKSVGLTVFPDIEEIGYGAFAFYEKDDGDWEAVPNNLQYISIPSSVKHIENGAFAFCDLERVYIAPNCPAAKIKDDAVLSKDGKRFIYKLVEKEFNDFDYKVPLGVEEIGNEAFNSCEMNVELAPSVKKICANAFGVFLNEIIIPQSVNEIEDNAFSKDCTLKVVKTPIPTRGEKKTKLKFKFLNNF